MLLVMAANFTYLTQIYKVSLSPKTGSIESDVVFIIINKFILSQ